MIWSPVGGGVDDTETRAAAVREVAEESGRRIAPSGPVVFTRHVDFALDGARSDQDEAYFVVRTDSFEPVSDGWTETEKQVMTSHRWSTMEELRVPPTPCSPKAWPTSSPHAPEPGARPEARLDTSLHGVRAKRSHRHKKEAPSRRNEFTYMMRSSGICAHCCHRGESTGPIFSVTSGVMAWKLASGSSVSIS